MDLKLTTAISRGSEGRRSLAHLIRRVNAIAHSINAVIGGAIKPPQVMLHVEIVLGIRGERLPAHNTYETVRFRGTAGSLRLILRAYIVVALEVLLELELVLDRLLTVDTNGRIGVHGHRRGRLFGH